jgi:hypothetical protein
MFFVTVEISMGGGSMVLGGGEGEAEGWLICSDSLAPGGQNFIVYLNFTACLTLYFILICSIFRASVRSKIYK